MAKSVLAKDEIADGDTGTLDNNVSTGASTVDEDRETIVDSVATGESRVKRLAALGMPNVDDNGPIVGV